MAGRFETWAKRLRFAWNDLAGGQAFVGGLGAVFDSSETWAKQANVEHQPQYAGDAGSVALIASERQIDAAPSEAQATLALRLTYAVPAWKLAGSHVGLLVALYEAGFTGAVIVQQNGVAMSITGTPNLADLSGLRSYPVPVGQAAWTPAVPSWLTLTTLGGSPYVGASQCQNQPLAVGGNAWWMFDATSLDASTPPQQFNSRYAILFPLTVAAYSFIGATATFTGAEDSAQATWSTPFVDANYRVIVGPACPSDGSIVSVVATTKTASAVTIVPSARFSGTVDVIGYEPGVISPSELARLQGIVARWQPRKATCVGIFSVAGGAQWGWPTGQTWGDGSLWGGDSVNVYPGP